MAHTEGSIQEVLNEHYKKSAKYCLNNMFVFEWESDVFVLQKSSGYSYDIEIKISRSDYLHDFTKIEKHSIVKDGMKPYRHKMNRNDPWIIDYKPHKFRPNKFYFCVPEGLIKKEEVPDYCGLMYITQSAHQYSEPQQIMKIVKEAPFLHREKLSYYHVLCDKFFYRWNNIIHEIQDVKRDYARLEKKYYELQKQLV